ncbi:hypothetical protein GGR53DRAFT_523962 [Hypoxylon sp. FL1150]|nr:hypothetical protein GGR53DRAFT_523962 [Hypoxylon sp. FL1150]
MLLAPGGLRVVVVSVISITLSFIAIILRIWARRLMKRSLALNDYMVITAMVFATGLISLALASCFAGGIGYQVTYLAPETTTLFWKMDIAGQMHWAAANTCVKLSILSLYTVLFPIKKLAYICYVIMALSMAYLISVTLLAVLLCKPMSYNWDKTIPGGRCEGVGNAFLAAGIANLVLDAFIVVLPMPLLFRLRMSMPKRLMVVSMFSLGGM